MSAEKIVLLDIAANGVATATLNRPEIGNAYNLAMLEQVTAGLELLAADPAVRCLVLRGAGRHFQAGADINWLNEAGQYPPEQALAASMTTVRTLALLNEFPKPTIAMVHGACFGGGVGIVCCADVALATPDSLFGITEIRVGTAPTPISTHMVNAIGLRQTRRYAITGERFDAAEACRIGLVHEVVAADTIESRLSEVIDAILLGGPNAIATIKNAILADNGLKPTESQIKLMAFEHNRARSSAEAQEGTGAFRQKRKPAWYAGGPTG
jgi:methylglutaconyl-CoA hydratase